MNLDFDDGRFLISAETSSEAFWMSRVMADAVEAGYDIREDTSGNQCTLLIPMVPNDAYVLKPNAEWFADLRAVADRVKKETAIGHPDMDGVTLPGVFEALLEHCLSLEKAGKNAAAGPSDKPRSLWNALADQIKKSGNRECHCSNCKERFLDDIPMTGSIICPNPGCSGYALNRSPGLR